MIRLLFILCSLSTLLFTKPSNIAGEVEKKSFHAPGSIEALIEDYSQTYFLVQLDLKNDSLYNIANTLLPNAELFNGPASYHRVMDVEHLEVLSNELTSDYFTILDDEYNIPNMSRSFWIEVHEGSEPEGTYTQDDAIEYTCSCLDGASDCVKLGWDDGWYNPFDYYGEAWYSYAPPNYQSIQEIRVTVTGAQCDALPVWSENYMGMRDDSGNWSQDYELSIDYTANVYVVQEIWNNGMLMPQIGSEDNYVIDKVKLEFFYTCDGPEYSPYNILADDQQSCSEINITWESSPSEFTSQNLYRDGELLSTFNADENSFTDYFATPGVQHLYCVEAVNECGVSAQNCNPGSLLSLPSTVQNVDASDGAYNNQVIITWDQNDNADSYKIYRDNIWLGLNNSSSDTEYIDQIAELDVLYEYCIEAINTCGTSDFACDSGFTDIGAGDINDDGEINVLDVVATVNLILQTEPISDDILFSADLNVDGEINVLDVVLIVNIILS